MKTSDALSRLRAGLGAGAPTSDEDLDRTSLIRTKPRLRRRAAAVLVGIFDAEDGARVVLTRRSTALEHHPGQIAFPGGKVEPVDSGSRATALREAREEIGLDPAGVEVLGEMAPHETVTGFTVVPVVARIVAPESWHPELGEVEEIFTVPWSHVMDRSRYTIQWRHWRGTERRYHAVPWGPDYIWGATARIFRALAEAGAR